MKQNAKSYTQPHLFSPNLFEMLDQKHELVILAKLIDWSEFNVWDKFFPSKNGRPATPSRMIAGLFYLQHTFALSDENTVRQWKENPYWQYFCGAQHFQTLAPINASSLSVWRKRIGVEAMELLLSQTVKTALTAGVIQPNSVEKIIIDTTVQEKAVSFPTDSNSLNDIRCRLVKLAEGSNITLPRNYNRLAKKILWMISACARSKQFKKMRKNIKKLSSWVRHIKNQVIINFDQFPEEIKEEAQKMIDMANILIAQAVDKKQENKIYSVMRVVFKNLCQSLKL